MLIEIHKFLFKRMHLKNSSAKWRPFCLDLKVLNAVCCTVEHFFLYNVGNEFLVIVIVIAVANMYDLECHSNNIFHDMLLNVTKSAVTYVQEFVWLSFQFVCGY